MAATISTTRLKQAIKGSIKDPLAADALVAILDNYNALLAKLDVDMAAINASLTKLDVDAVAQNAAVTSSQLDVDYASTNPVAIDYSSSLDIDISI